MDNCMICKNECDGISLARETEARAVICETCRLRISAQKLRIVGVSEGKVLVADDVDRKGLVFEALNLGDFPKYCVRTSAKHTRQPKPNDYETPFRRRERERREGRQNA